MLSFRKATIDDAELYFNWVNEEEVRKSSFQSNLIKWDSHIEWFKSKIESEYSLLLICYSQHIPIGQVRVDMDFDSHIGVINYSIEKSMRGKGYATLILKELHHYFATSKKGIKLMGMTKCNNYASQNVFLKAGFLKETGIHIVNKIECYKFYKLINETHIATENP